MDRAEIVDDCSGQTVSIYKHELDLLVRIAECGSDLKCCYKDRDFPADPDLIQAELFSAIRQWQQWRDEFDRP